MDHKLIVTVYCNSKTHAGSCPPDSKAARYVIAKLTTARWITFQSRCLRLYISGTVPQEHVDFLEVLATYIVKVYAPVRTTSCSIVIMIIKNTPPASCPVPR